MEVMSNGRRGEEEEGEEKRKEERRNAKVAFKRKVDVAQQRQTLPSFIDSSAGRSCVLVFVLLVKTFCLFASVTLDLKRWARWPITGI